jgi:hypothetical protein
MKRADTLLTPFLKSSGIQDGVKLAAMRAQWHHLFSKPLSYHILPFRFSQGELILNVDSHVWLQELNFLKRDIVKKLSPYGVRTVRLRIGKTQSKTGNRLRNGGVKSTTYRELTSTELSYIEATVSSLPDEQLRRTVRTILEKAIATGRTKIALR